MRAVYDPKRLEENYPVIHQPKITTMNRKLIIEAAVPGWQPEQWWKDRGVKRLPPRSLEAQAEAIVECVKAGASVIHTHPRHPNDGLPRAHDPELLAEIMDRAFAKVDFITCHHNWCWDFSKSKKADYITYTKELLEKGKGNKYVQAGMIMTMGVMDEELPVFTIDRMQEGVQFYESNGIKPMFSVECPGFTRLKEAVFDNALAKWKPYWLSLQMGKHGDNQVFADPWSYIQVINNISMVRESIPDSFIGIHPGGRNWLPVSVMGLLYGCELIRVGIEDIFWIYPHKDDISQKASDTVELIAKIAKDLGREVATVEEARNRIGIRLT